MAAATHGLLSLPTEILSYVCTFLSPENVLSFALSSRACALGAADVLCGLQNIFFEYKIINDEDPIDLLQKLRIILQDDFRAGCIRQIEIGDVRMSWEDWPRSEESKDEQPESADDDDRSLAELQLQQRDSFFESNEWQKYFSHDELENYRRLLRAYIFRNFTANTLTNEHLSMLRSGQDDVVKLLLIASSPKLESLTFYSSRPRNPSEPGIRPHPLFYSILAQDQDIRQIFNPQTRWFARNSPRENPWPPGFLSLKNISIDMPLPSGQPSESFHASPPKVAGIFWLPNIETIELHHLRHRWEGDEWIDIKIGCSSVRELVFESCQIKVSTLLRFITASRALERLTIRKCGKALGIVGDLVGEWYAESLGK